MPSGKAATETGVTAAPEQGSVCPAAGDAAKIVIGAAVTGVGGSTEASSTDSVAPVELVT